MFTLLTFQALLNVIKAGEKWIDVVVELVPSRGKTEWATIEQLHSEAFFQL